MHIHGPLKHVRHCAPDLLQDFVAGKTPPGLRSKQKEDFEFFPAQGKLLSVDRNAASRGVETQRAGLQDIAAVLAAAPEDSLDAGEYLAGREGLANVVVSSGGESRQKVVFPRRVRSGKLWE